MFTIGECVYAGYKGSCVIHGIITYIDGNEYGVEYDTPGGGGSFLFEENDLCRGCDTPKADCKCR